MAGGHNAKGTVKGDGAGVLKDRSWLLPSNRKLRHLQGLSLRNLELSRPLARARGKTIDDESLPSTLKTAEKALAQRENLKLEHSRSSVDLKQKAKEIPEQTLTEKREAADQRPSLNSLKRSNTLNWSNATPRTRQQRLERATVDRMADIWFSLHVDGVEEPVYVSEVVGKTMNPSFQFFDLNSYGAFVTRRDEITIRFWAKTETSESDTQLIELQVSLRSLYFLGKTLENFNHPLPHNAVLFHLSDGIYTSFTDLPTTEHPQARQRAQKAAQHVETTSSFDALMQLSNLDNCIQDALSTREKLTTQINKLLLDQQAARDTVDAASQAQESLAATHRSFSACRKQFQTMQNHRSRLQNSLSTRRNAISSGQGAQQEAEAQLETSRRELTSRKQARQNLKADLSGQIRRIGEDLSSIYPITPLAAGSLSFSVRNLHLPVAGTQPEQDFTTSSVALGHAAHITHLLSYYLSTPLPYPITPSGSTSTIYDPISTSMPSEAARTFPLFSKGAVAYRFEYGVFLLNSNIELLMSRQDARLIDLRYTLGNLKYILTVITDGKGEIPGRKRGQIKALNGGSVTGSRSSSMASRHREKKTMVDGHFEARELKRALAETRTK